MKRLQCASVLFLMLFHSVCLAATDYYVAADGNDENSGLSATEAKATIAAAYTAMTNGTVEATAGNRLIVGEGEFEFPAFPLVLTNGQSIVGSDGAVATLKLRTGIEQSEAIEYYSAGMFVLTTADTALKNLTVHFNNIPLKLNGALLKNPKGKVIGCTFTGYTNPVYNAMHGCNMVYVGDATCAPEIRNCRFTKGKNPHIGYTICVDAAASVLIDSCSFTDFTGGHSMGSIGVRNDKSATVIRNCLFARCDIDWSNNNAARAQVIYTPDRANAVIIDNCTIADCTAYGWSKDGAANDLQPIHGQATVRNTLIYNIRKNDGTPLQYETGNGRSKKYSHCASDRVLDGTDNILLGEDALLLDFSDKDDYVVLSGATIDAGAVLDWMDETSVDIRNSTRMAGLAPDIGCFELKARPKVFYVMADGDDDKDGLSAETAKATIAGAYEALTNDAPNTENADSIIVGDGEFDLTGYTMKFVGRQKMSSRNGPEKTKLNVPSHIVEGTKTDRTGATYQLFDFADSKVEFRGFTVDFRKKSYSYVNSALAKDPQGRISNCVFENYSSARIESAYVVSIYAAVAPVFSNCVFRNIHCHYRSSAFRVDNAYAAPVLTHCTFQDIDCGDYYSYGTVHVNSGSLTLRNCLFLRCRNHQDMHSGKYRSATIHANGQTVIENCSLIDCRFQGEAYESEAGKEWAALSGPIIKGETVLNTLVYGCTNQFGEIVSCKTGPTYSHVASDAPLGGESNILLAEGSLKFRKPWKGDYTVQSGPTVNAGMELDWMSGATDLLGRPRVIGGTPDIGCFEFDPSEIKGTTIVVR